MHGIGCSSCRYTGYTGRSGLFELLVVNDEVQQLILKRASAREIGAVGQQNGMRPLRQHGWETVLAGITTIEEVVRSTAQEDLT